MAIVTLDLLSDWHRWVHRRVEMLAVEDPGSIRRRVSIDFTLESTVPPVLGERRGNGVYCVPLAALRKRRLKNFSLRDETERALPVMTAEKNGAVAAGVLAHASEDFADAPASLAEMPGAVWRDLWNIANSSSDDAQATWENLGRPVGADGPERAWRDALIQSEQFMALASDLARNFLVLVPLESHANERRIVKLSYQEAEPERVPQAEPRSPGRFHQLRSRLRRSPRPPEMGQEGVGLVTFEATLVETDDQGNPRTNEHGQELPGNPLPNLDVVIRGPDGVPGEQTVKTNQEGRAYSLLVAGEYRVEPVVPRGLLEVTRVETVRVEPGNRSTIRLKHRRIGTLAMRHTFDAPRKRESRPQRFVRFFGGRSQRLVFLVPAIGQASSYHVEFEAPEGLAVTRGRLDARESYWRDDPDEDVPVTSDIDRITTGRSHLYLAQVSQGCSGRAIFNLRPKPSTIIRAAVMASAVTALLLAAVSLDLRAVRGNVGATVALLLLVPGALSAYVIRPREHPFTTRTALGLRLMASAPALYALLAAVLIVLSRPWHPASSGYRPGASWSGTGAALWVLTGLAVGACALLFLSWRVSSRPPEQKN